MFTLAIFCLTTSNLLCFTALTSQVPMQYYSLQHPTLLPSPITSTARHCFCLGAISSFFLELVLYSSPVAYRATTDLESSSFSILFILFMGSHGKNTEMVCYSFYRDHTLSENSTMTHMSLVALRGMAHNFIELDKAVVHLISLISFLWMWFSTCLPSYGKG